MKILIDSNQKGSQIYGVCSDCGNKALKMPENRNKIKFGISTYHMGDCDVCHKLKPITQVRDFGFPVFKVNARAADLVAMVAG